MSAVFDCCAVELQWMGTYEYNISLKFNMPSDTAHDVWCGLYRASLLTIYDDQELRFVVENITLPLKVEHKNTGLPT